MYDKGIKMHKYRTNTCGEINENFIGREVKLSGWINSKRDHGGLIFIDLRDHYGMTQCVIDTTYKDFSKLEHLRIESVIMVVGKIAKRSEETINKNLFSGMVELKVDSVEIISSADVLPVLVATDELFPEDLRLKYRYIDLRRQKLQKTITLRSKIIKAMRDYMWSKEFNELQTPILTSSSPEGARDFLVPSRMHPGTFYALPQAPQQFKQLAMVAGFDKYFQIAPCFRDEDTRADRVLEFYQLDMEMSFATQDDVLEVAKGVVESVFNQFKGNRKIAEWQSIPYQTAMEKYGSDKPDLRNPLIICDATEVFKNSNFAIFAGAIENGCVVKAILTKNTNSKPRSWFDNLNEWARENKAKGLGYITFDENGESKGPIAKNLDKDRIETLKKLTGAENNDSVFFVCDKLSVAQKFAGQTRIKLGQDLDLIEKNVFKFAFIKDFPFYEKDEATGKIDFGHNPFSMPQTDIRNLKTEEDLLSVKAFQYDIVCNGYEMASGAVRNYDTEIMVRAFENVGYTRADVEKKFSGMMNAFRFGVPPHAGIALGVDRIVMLLADEPNLREVILFPINGKGEDLMMGAPSVIDEKQLRELSIKVDIRAKK